MDIEDKIKLWAVSLAVILPIIFAGTAYIKRVLDLNEWNIKKQICIYEELNKFNYKNINIKEYAKYYSEYSELFKNIKEEYKTTKIRSELKKSIDDPIYIQDFQKYIENYKSD